MDPDRIGMGTGEESRIEEEAGKDREIGWLMRDQVRVLCQDKGDADHVVVVPGLDRPLEVDASTNESCPSRRAEVEEDNVASRESKK
jgi:hypothetical protein